jgi:alkanesulfonate monooxygenase SsuD/methylene tetrahydromethanopterin reductase-like flavin-dependent oxidoreductase (luciferase family)
MKLSLFIGAEHRASESMAQRLSEYAEQVRLARQLLFDGVSIGNHLSYASTAWFPPFETLMRLAAEAELPADWLSNNGPDLGAPPASAE